MNKAIFIDKDGTLIPDLPFNVDPERIRLAKNAVDGLKLLKKDGFLLIAISNQAGVAYGCFQEDALKAVSHKINTLLAAHGLQLDGFYYCPHHPGGTIRSYAVACDCRKPEPGLILRAARDHHIDLKSSWMIGDILNDVEAGNRAGCRTILIDTGNETEWTEGPYRQPTFICNHIDSAAGYIINKQAG